MKLFQQIVESSKLEDLDDALRPIQQILGQDDGGLAAILYSETNPVKQWGALSPAQRLESLKKYVIHEIVMFEG